MLKVVEQCCRVTGSKPTSAMVRNCSREIGPWMSSASSTLPVPTARSRSCRSLDERGRTCFISAFVCKHSIACHRAGLGTEFASPVPPRTKQIPLDILHTNPARTYGTPVHLLAEAAHGVAELAHVQRAAQVRICRMEDMLACSATLTLMKALLAVLEQNAQKHPSCGTARESWPQAHAHSTTRSCCKLQGASCTKTKLCSWHRAGMLCAVLTQCVEQRRQPLAPRDLGVIRAVCRLCARARTLSALARSHSAGHELNRACTHATCGCRANCPPLCPYSALLLRSQTSSWNTAYHDRT